MNRVRANGRFVASFVGLVSGFAAAIAPVALVAQQPSPTDPQPAATTDPQVATEVSRESEAAVTVGPRRADGSSWTTLSSAISVTR